jgi:hypothetical protein
MKKPIGWQIVERGTDNPPDGMTIYEVYSLEYVMAWLRHHYQGRWRLLPVREGELKEAVDRTAEIYREEPAI